MLTNLSIRNYALIENINIDFKTGLTVITGETGAGKSIIIDAVDMLLGARANSSIIRTGTDLCTISAIFDISNNTKVKDILNDLSIDFQDEIIIRRQIESSGKNKSFINDIAVSISTLSNIGKYLVAFYAQHKSNLLFDKSYQLQIVDNIANNKELLIKLSDIYSNLKKVQKQKDDIINSNTEKERMLDLYNYQLNEIKKANLNIDDDINIEKELPKLKNAEKIKNTAFEISNILYSKNESVLDNLSKITKQLDDLQSFGIDTKVMAEQLNNSTAQLDDIYRQAQEIAQDTDLNPDLLNEMFERQQLIKKLKTKYGKTIEDILNYQTELEQNIKTLNNYEQSLEQIEKEIKELTKKINDICEKISSNRKRVIKPLKENIIKELEDLNINNALFEISIQKQEITQTGFDNVEFMFSANKGEKIQSLSEVASGGEISRIMLALATTISKHYNIPTIIFDEIDTGTSGKTGDKIGKKLKQISKDKQVISISHLAQIAASAKNHLKIFKETIKDRTTTHAKLLNKQEHIEEVANIISGKTVTQNAIKHAKELIEDNN